MSKTPRQNTTSLSVVTLQSGLLVQYVDTELIVYNPHTGDAHLLNSALAIFFEKCRQKNGELKLQLDNEEEQIQSFQLIDSGLASGEYLSEKELKPVNQTPLLNRRQALKAASGLILTLSLPRPAAAASSLCEGLGCPTGATGARCTCNDGTVGVLCLGFLPGGCGGTPLADAHETFCTGRDGIMLLECCVCP